MCMQWIFNVAFVHCCMSSIIYKASMYMFQTVYLLYYVYIVLYSKFYTCTFKTWVIYIPLSCLLCGKRQGNLVIMKVARFSCLSLGLPTRTMFSLVDFKTLRYMKWGWKSGLSNSWDSRGGQNLPTPLPLWLDKPLHPFYCYVWYILHFTVYTALHIPCF